MADSWLQVFSGRGSIYALDANTKQWSGRGVSGLVTMFQNSQNRQDIRLKWEKNEQGLWWRLTSTKIKSKGERALILKAFTIYTNQQEILAIRFNQQQTCFQFAEIYAKIFPMTSIDINIYNPPPAHVPKPKMEQVVVDPNLDWKCGVCTYQNAQSCAKCAFCGYLPNPQPKYGDANKFNDDIYEDPESDNDINKWKCTACTFSNYSWNDRCEICSAKRRIVNDKPNNVNFAHHRMDTDINMNVIGSPLYNTIPDKRFSFERNNKSWNCPICTLLNKSTDERCDACNTARNVNSNHAFALNNVNNQANDMKYNQCDYDRMINVGLNNYFDNNYFESTMDDFSRAASDIACFNDWPVPVFSTLRSVARKLLKDDEKYSVLDTTNAIVVQRLIGYEGVVDFLKLLGFESDALGIKLRCRHKPSQRVVDDAIYVLDSYKQRFKVTNNGLYNNVNVQTGGYLDENMANHSNNQRDNDILSLEQIIHWSTHENIEDNASMETLIMTHKMFTDSVTLLQQLRKRFFVPIPGEILNNEMLIKQFQNGTQKRIQLKVIKSLKDWMKLYWYEDFEKNEVLQWQLEEWLDELSVYHELDMHNIDCVWISKLCFLVKKEYLRLKGIDWNVKKQMNIVSLFDDVYVGGLNINKLNSVLSKASGEELADQITLMDYGLFSKIEPRECLHQIRNNGTEAPNILSIIQQFNNFTIFIQIRILRERALKKRAIAIRKIIKMGRQFKLRRNYNSLCAVFSALKSAPIHRLKLAWNRVPERVRLQFEEWSVIFCRDRNHRNLRQLLRKAGGNPCIPHIGVFLQDLVFIDEGNKKKVPHPAFNGNQMLNFNKCVRIADRIKHLQLFQHHEYNNKIQENRKIQSVLLMELDKLKDVTEDQLWDMSTNVKKQDEKEAKQPLIFFGGGANKNAPLNQIPPILLQQE